MQIKIILLKLIPKIWIAGWIVHKAFKSVLPSGLLEKFYQFILWTQSCETFFFLFAVQH